MTENSTVDIENLRKLVAEALELPVEEVTDHAAFADELEIDSLMLMEIGVVVEEGCGVKLSDDELASTTTLSDLARLVGEKQHAPA